MLNAKGDGHKDKKKASIQRLKRISALLDETFQIPFTNNRIGLEALIGIIPGAGDLLTAIISIYFVYIARKMNLPSKTKLKMVYHILVDLTAGIIPFAGDAFDFYYKANKKNVDLILDHLQKNNLKQEYDMMS